MEDAKGSVGRALMAAHRAGVAMDQANAAARAAYASKAKADILKAGDLYRYAGALYEQAAVAWKALGRKEFAAHAAEMAERLSGSPFARCSLEATFAAT